jgi:hypothetical protein
MYLIMVREPDTFSSVYPRLCLLGKSYAMLVEVVDSLSRNDELAPLCGMRLYSNSETTIIEYNLLTIHGSALLKHVTC